VDFAAAASQNGLTTFNLYIHKETNIMKKMTKIKTKQFLSSLSETRHETIWHICRVMQTQFLMQPLGNPPLCSSTFWSSKTTS
jgi:hypothetical protein